MGSCLVGVVVEVEVLEGTQWGTRHSVSQRRLQGAVRSQRCMEAENYENEIGAVAVPNPQLKEDDYVVQNYVAPEARGAGDELEVEMVTSGGRMIGQRVGSSSGIYGIHRLVPRCRHLSEPKDLEEKVMCDKVD